MESCTNESPKNHVFSTHKISTNNLAYPSHLISEIWKKNLIFKSDVTADGTHLTYTSWIVIIYDTPPTLQSSDVNFAGHRSVNDLVILAAVIMSKEDLARSQQRKEISKLMCLTSNSMKKIISTWCNRFVYNFLTKKSKFFFPFDWSLHPKANNAKSYWNQVSTIPKMRSNLESK